MHHLIRRRKRIAAYILELALALTLLTLSVIQIRVEWSHYQNTESYTRALRQGGGGAGRWLTRQ